VSSSQDNPDRADPPPRASPATKRLDLLLRSRENPRWSLTDSSARQRRRSGERCVTEEETEAEQRSSSGGSGYSLQTSGC